MLRIVFATIAGFLSGFQFGAFLFLETVNPDIPPQVILMGLVWVMFTVGAARISYSITRDRMEKEEWEAAALRRYELNRMGGER